MVAKGSRQLERSATHLIHRAGQCATDIFQVEARSSGLTPRQFAVLMTIAEEEGLTQTDLVDRTGIDRSRGLIHRKRAKEDGRAYAIKLTSQGWRGLRDAEPGAAATDSRLLAVLPPPKRQEFLDTLALIVGATNK